jgi:membrane associated rhomboid family serine protease
VSSAAGAEVDPSVCYRHPDRASWTLCERCGRTICPECQILTPSGVRCPDCVRELGGSVQWAPAGGSRAAATKAKQRRARVTTRSLEDRPRWQQVISNILRPGDATPVATWVIVAVSVVIWIAGFFTPLPGQLLVATPFSPWQVWGFATGAFVGAGSILSFILSMVFFLLIAPTSERELGRRKFLLVFFAAVIAGNALAVIAGVAGFGLYGALYGLIGSTLITIWGSPAARTQFLILFGVYLLITIVLSPSLLFEVIGGIIGGTGSAYLLHRYEDTPRLTRRAHLIIAGSLVALVAIAILRSVLALA